MRENESRNGEGIKETSMRVPEHLWREKMEVVKPIDTEWSMKAVRLGDNTSQACNTSLTMSKREFDCIKVA